MPQPPDWKRVLETGMQFTEMRRSHAHRIASDLVAQGQIARDQIGAAVDELVEMSRRRSEELRAIVSSEVQRQLSVIGLATKRDLEELERRLRGQVPATGTRARKSGGTKRPATKKTAARAPATKKPARKAPVKSTATARKPAAKKTVGKVATRRTSKTVRRPGARRAR